MQLYVNVQLILRIFFISCVLSQDIVIQTKNGNLRGTTLTSTRGNKTFHAFMGIPYAKPPIGNLRFKDPQPADSWTGVRDATAEGSVCPQLNFESGKYKGDEDCLFLNVYTTALKKKDSLQPVMVWIHGGSFLTESGNMEYAGPHFLIEEDIIFVSINYRLGPLGFFCLANEEVPGNAGLKDQVLALKWVQENIKQFGGDPSKVTIAGESAGSFSVEFHKLSPWSKGLFRGAISESGTALYLGDILKYNASIPFIFGEMLQIKTKNETELLQKLRMLTAQEITEAIKDYGYFPLLIFFPTIDKDFGLEDKFLPDDPVNLFNSGKFNKVPSIIGINSAEGIMLTLVASNFTDKIEEFIKLSLGSSFKNDFLASTYNEAIGNLKDFYFRNTTNDLTILQDFVNYTTDIAFYLGTYCTTQKVATHSSSPMYLYEFDFVGEMNLYKKMFGGWNLTGACHVDEQLYIYSSSEDKFEVGSRELKTSRRMVRMWANFVKTGNPTPTTDPLLENFIWSPINKTAEGYLYINDNLTFIDGHIREPNIGFWTELYQNYTKRSICWDENSDGGGPRTFSDSTSLVIFIFLLYLLPRIFKQ